MIEVNYNPDVLSCLANLSNDEVFTPPQLVNEILDMLPTELFESPETTFLDPVTKSGVFLREIAKRLNDGLATQIPDHQERINHIFKNQVFGIAITELTSLLARRSTYCTKKANGDYSVCTDFDTEEGNIKYDRITHTWKKGQCVYCGASEEVYKRDGDLETYAYQFIHTEKPQDIFKMKFDVIIGNPPYQLSDSGFGTSAKPIYHLFVEQAKKLNPRFLSFIIPARWFSGGKGLDEFRKSMLNDSRLREIHDFPDASDVFPGVQIKGGVCFFLWNREEIGLCEVSSYNKQGLVSKMSRPLLEKDCESFIRYNEAVSILNKVRSFGEPSMKESISSRKPFGLDTKFKGRSNKLEGGIKVYRNGGVGYAELDEIKANRELIGYYKVLIPPLGSGSDSFPHPILGTPFIAEPSSACSETYIIAGISSSIESAENLRDYLTTKFLRFLVLLNKPTQHATSKVYVYVPKLDFKEKWTDEKLYSKYGITQKEQDFIDSLIRPVEL